MQERFEGVIRPFVQVGPLSFGMSPDAVIQAMSAHGSPTRLAPDAVASTNLSWLDMSVTASFADARLVYVNCSPHRLVSVTAEGIDLFRETNREAIRRLTEIYGEHRSVFGFAAFVRAGLILIDHDGERAVNAWAEAEWSRQLASFDDARR